MKVNENQNIFVKDRRKVKLAQWHYGITVQRHNGTMAQGCYGIKVVGFYGFTL